MPSVVTNSVHDHTSQAYKKAKRQHLKTTRGRDNQVETDWTPFRAAEKKYKAKFPPPDLSEVLDLALLDDTRKHEIETRGWRGSVDVVQYKEIELLSDAKGKKAYTFSRVPGASRSQYLLSVLYVFMSCVMQYIRSCPSSVLCPSRGAEGACAMVSQRPRKTSERDES